MTTSSGDNFGAVLIDYESEDFPVVRLIESFDRETHERYTAAHSIVSSYQSESMFVFVRDESIKLIDYLIEIGKEAESRGRPIERDARGTDVRDGIAAHVLAVANAYFVYRDQRKAQAKRLGDERSDDTESRVTAIVDRLYADCPSYRWLVESRNALVHLDLMGTVGLQVSVGREGPAFVLTLSRDIILQTNNMKRANMADYRAELQAMPSDLVVLDLLQEALPAVAKADGEIRDAMYPSEALADASATVRELIGRFRGRRGGYCLQTGPGFTEDRPIPQFTPLSQNVLAFAEQFDTSPALPVTGTV